MNQLNTHHFFSYIMLTFKVIIYIFSKIIVPRAAVLSGGARRRSWAQTPRRKYMGKYIPERKSLLTGGRSVLANKEII